ncbi:MAG: aquaporin, partial [Bryobacteraceae bacterium]
MQVSTAMLGEFVGTMILILLGNGVVGGVLLASSKAEGAGWLSIAAGWGLAVFSAVAVSISIGDTDAHINPAFTVASVLMTGHPSR